jgi:DNA-binding PadR family transcriptional regulator
MKLLSRAEEIMLLTIMKLQENAYGVAIREQLYRDTGTRWSFGSIYTPLNKLTRKDFVIKRYSEPTQERGGRRKCVYSITSRGIKALQEIERVQKSVWSDLPASYKKQED